MFEVLPLNVCQSVEDKYPLVELEACATSILVPEPITAFDPFVIVNIAELFSVKFPFVKAGSLLLNVDQSALDKAPLFADDAVGMSKVILPLAVTGEFDTDISVPAVPNAKPILVTVPEPAGAAHVLSALK